MLHGVWGCNVFLIFVIVPLAALAAPPGVIEGHLNIVSLKEVELAHNDETPATALTQKAYAKNYAEYPVIILSKESRTEVARATADKRGNFRVSLPAGDYILDIQGRGRTLVRANPQPFTVVSGQTVHVNMNLDTGVR